jgi:hypothetical protein
VNNRLKKVNLTGVNEMKDSPETCDFVFKCKIAYFNEIPLADISKINYKMELVLKDLARQHDFLVGHTRVNLDRSE